MKSIAIKTNNSQTIEYFKNNFEQLDLANVSFSCKNFKHFTNIIIHYKGKDIQEFLKEISTIISFLVIYEFEEDFLKKIIYQDYFYFSKIEREKILENCFNIIIDSNSIIKEKFEILFLEFSEFLKDNNKIYLNGFINFRLQKYLRYIRKNS